MNLVRWTAPEPLRRRPLSARRCYPDGFGPCVVEEVDEVTLMTGFCEVPAIQEVKCLDLVALLGHGGRQVGVARVDLPELHLPGDMCC